jgi:hypothetical protein
MRLIAVLRRHGIAFLALMVALGGGAYAQSRIGTADLRNNAVGPKKIKKNAVRGKHIKAGAVRPKKVRNNSLGARKLRNLRSLESSGWVGLDNVDEPVRLARSPRGNVVLRTSCLAVPGGMEAKIVLAAPPPAGTVLTGTDGVPSTVFDGVQGGEFGAVTASPPAAGQRAGSFSFISRGDVLQGTFHTAVNAQNVGCLFAVSVSG